MTNNSCFFFFVSLIFYVSICALILENVETLCGWRSNSFWMQLRQEKTWHFSQFLSRFYADLAVLIILSYSNYKVCSATIV